MTSTQAAARQHDQRDMQAVLADYDIDPINGFVVGVDPALRLPGDYAVWDDVAADLSALIRTRRIRAVLAALPQLDPLALESEAERERAMLLLTMFGNAWVWGGDEPDLRMPASIAVPLCALATHLDRPPIAHYASMTLRNWRRINPAEPVCADNTEMQVHFLGGVDETWFFIASLGVETEGAPLLPLIYAAARDSRDGSEEALTALLTDIATGMDRVLVALERMREWCAPYIFYHRVRPFVAGWPAPGVVYEGVSEEPQQLMGGSAAQSSLIQALDAVLGVAHPGATSGDYLRAMRRYMPGPHRRFVVDIEDFSTIRERAAGGGEALRKAYNAAVSQVEMFRQRHIAMAHDFIAKPSGMAVGEKGTGGTDFAEFLRNARVATTQTKM